MFLENEIRLYYGGSDGLHTSWRNGYFCLATLRPDGFAGYTPTKSGEVASVTTTGVDYPGGLLRLSADVEPGGYVQVKVLDAGGNTIAESKAITQSVTDATVVWGNKFSLDQLETAIRLQFVFKDATVFSFNFAE